MSKYIFISGVIGSGKSTLCERICQRYDMVSRKEDIYDTSIIPRISQLYNNFDRDTIFEVQKHFIKDSDKLISDLSKDQNYVFDTFPFISQKVFLESLIKLNYISIEQYEELEELLYHTNLDVFLSSSEFLHIHCVTPIDVFDRIYNRNSFEVNSYNSYGQPNKELVNLIDELDNNYYLSAITEKTLFNVEENLDEVIENFILCQEELN